MSLQAVFTNSFVAALRALIGFFTRMQAHMRSKITGLCKPLVAMMACKWLFIGVSAQVSLQAGFVESFVVAFRALVQLSTIMYYLNMLIKSSFRFVLLVKMFTSMFLFLQFVHLHMCLEIAGLCETLVAMLAYVWFLL